MCGSTVAKCGNNFVLLYLFSSREWGDIIKRECTNDFRSGWTNAVTWSVSTQLQTLFGFCSGSSTVVNMKCCDLSSGQMVRFALPLSFTLNRIYLRTRKWLCSCHNWSTARRDGSACFCYYLFHLSQNRILNLHCIPLSHRPLHDQYPHQRLCRDSGILWSMFVELDLLS